LASDVDHQNKDQLSDWVEMHRRTASVTVDPCFSAIHCSASAPLGLEDAADLAAADLAAADGDAHGFGRGRRNV
jgi:hypothetical protein